MPNLRVALAQTNPRLGDFAGNSVEILASVVDAHAAGADIIAFPEMALSGYPIEDLAVRPEFLAVARKAIEQLGADIAQAGAGSVPVIVGFPHGPAEPGSQKNPNPSAIAHNSAAVLLNGKIAGIYNKHHLPNYGVFDEFRNFIPGTDHLLIRVRGIDVAVLICEDIWRDGGACDELAQIRPGLVVVINGSPFEQDKDDVRLPLVARRAVAAGTAFAYLNLVGGQDDLVFDGDSFIVDHAGDVLARAASCATDLLVTDLDVPLAENRTHITPSNRGAPRVTVVDAGSEGEAKAALPPRASPPVAPDERERIWDALVLGLRDYIEKNGFPSVILGLSGGIDSAVCAALAVDAVGPERVFGVSMPSQWSSDHSKSDAADVAERLGIRMTTEPIAGLVAPVESQLQLTGLAAENVQARMRGVILMGLSNMDGHLVLTTGNKTEIAVGYSTIYGDSVGGFAPIRDVPKTLVWDLARWRNSQAQLRGENPPIPENSITKPPSAELRPGQVDQDSLPPYDQLDAMLEAYITRRLGRDEVIALGFDAATVDRVIGLVDRAEWKRRQGAIGPKISGMAFGRDRRLPVTFHRS
jgi:NAD+ synthase (glutamine-hydrolysing)